VLASSSWFDLAQQVPPIPLNSFDEATGTVKVRPELRYKVAKSLMREAARIQRRLLLRQFKLQVSYIVLDTKRTVLLMASYLLSFMK